MIPERFIIAMEATVMATCAIYVVIWAIIQLRKGGKE